MAGRQNVNVDYLKHTLKLSNDWGVAPPIVQPLCLREYKQHHLT